MINTPISVKSLLEQIKAKVEPPFATVYVVGEVSNFRGSGRHWYFTLKEEGASIQCAIWASQQRFISCIPKDGVRVLVSGSLNLYVVGGTLTLIVNSCILAGIGALQAQLHQLEIQLRAEGVFDRPKRAIPRFPRKVGIVAAIGGAALWDVIKVTGRRAPNMDLLIIAAAAQGDRAVPENILALQEIQDPFWACDVILLVRGGGSLEDLWAYNDPELVRAVANCRLPIITGIGHEIDTTLVDLAADLRAATPSQAAELVTPDRRQLMNEVKRLQDKLVHRVSWCLSRLETNLNLLVDSKGIRSIVERIDRNEITLTHTMHRLWRYHLAGKLVDNLNNLIFRLHLTHPQRRLDQANGRLQLLRQRLIHVASLLSQATVSSRLISAAYSMELTIDAFLLTSKHHLEVIITRLYAMDPNGPLSRGFVLVKDTAGKPITNAKTLPVLAKVELNWLDGKRLAQLKD